MLSFVVAGACGGWRALLSGCAPDSAVVSGYVPDRASISTHTQPGRLDTHVE